MRVLAGLLAILALTVTTPTVSAATSTNDLEHDLLDMINDARTSHGLKALRYGKGQWSVAGYRAARMASTNVLSHSVAGSIGSQLKARHVPWYTYGEDIGYTRAKRGKAAIAELFRMWKASPSHWKLMMSSSYNYIGVGIAYRSSNRKTFSSLIFTESRDLTGSKASMDGVGRDGNQATWSWHGWDPVLQTHTAGLKSFDVQTRVGSGGWRTVARKTTATARRWTGLASGHTYGMRVRARDRAGNVGSGRRKCECGCPDPVRTRRFVAVNLISDPIHGYIELTKRLTVGESAVAGLPDEDVAEQDLLDTAWVQRLRRISQLQSARWVFPTAEHSRFTHGLGVMHEAGAWARSLYPTLQAELVAAGDPAPSEGLVVETLRIAGLLHDVGHGPFAHFFDDHVLSAFSAPADPRRTPGKRLTHEDLSGRIIEDELGPLIRGLRRAPGSVPERDAFADDETIDPAWVAYLISKPAIVDRTMPRWLRWLQPLLSGVFTVDNLDYVRRDAYLTGVATGPVDVERLRRYSFISAKGLTLYEPGLGALEIFLTARRFMYQQVYFHRTVRAIDLDLAAVFGPSVRALVGDSSPAENLRGYADLDEYALLHQAARWARGESIAAAPTPGDGTATSAIADAWRAILLRQPTWRAEAEIRAEYEADSRPDALIASLGVAEPGRVAIDLAEVDARPAEASSTDGLLALETRDGTSASLASALASIPAYWLIGRRYRRVAVPG